MEGTGMTEILKNSLTTIPGVIQLLIVLWNIWQTRNVNLEDLREALVGVGFIMAKDFNFTGGTRS
jgi:hypothetical protein